MACGQRGARLEADVCLLLFLSRSCRGPGRPPGVRFVV